MEMFAGEQTDERSTREIRPSFQALGTKAPDRIISSSAEGGGRRRRAGEEEGQKARRMCHAEQGRQEDAAIFVLAEVLDRVRFRFINSSALHFPGSPGTSDESTDEVGYLKTESPFFSSRSIRAGWSSLAADEIDRFRWQVVSTYLC